MPSKPKTSYLWKYFAQTVPTQAKCNLCAQVLSVTNSCIGNLARHLRLKHRDLVVSREPTLVESKYDGEDHSKPPSKYAWRYFSRLSGNRAQCAVCDSVISSHTVSNLARHIANKHGDIDITKEPIVALVDQNGDKAGIWRFFEVTDEDISEARCAVCLEEVSYSAGTDEMRRHLASSHPDLAAGKFDQIYIEDNARTPTPEQVAVRRRKKKKRPKTPDTTDSEDNRPVKPKKKAKLPDDARMDEDASIENFGRYIVSLIKKLPRHVACKIQMDFVTLIMQAQLEHERSQSGAAAAAGPVGDELSHMGLVNGEHNGDVMAES